MAEALYADRLVEIFPDRIVFRRYYLPFFRWGSRTVPLANLERVDRHANSLDAGRWRIWGTGGGRTWFPFDASRPSRTQVFHAVPRSSRAMRIGFTVEDSYAVSRVLADLGLMNQEAPPGHE